ncbi:hypothetical protein WJX77_012097 [Trebouxia sp. C0004]
MISSLSDLHLCLHEAPCVLPTLALHPCVRRHVHRRQGFTAARPRVSTQTAHASASSLHPNEGSTLLDDTVAVTQHDISPSQLRSLWDGVGKPLLRVGKGGVQASHINSLRELLHSHALIKSAAQQGASANQRASQQHLERVWHNANGVEVPIQLQPDVQAQLQFLNSAGVLLDAELDRKCLRVLSQMPEGPALTLLKGMNKSSMRAVRNKSAWLNSQCRRITAQARS